MYALSPDSASASGFVARQLKKNALARQLRACPLFEANLDSWAPLRILKPMKNEQRPFEMAQLSQYERRGLYSSSPES